MFGKSSINISVIGNTLEITICELYVILFQKHVNEVSRWPFNNSYKIINCIRYDISNFLQKHIFWCRGKVPIEIALRSGLVSNNILFIHRSNFKISVISEFIAILETAPITVKALLWSNGWFLAFIQFFDPRQWCNNSHITLIVLHGQNRVL